MAFVRKKIINGKPYYYLVEGYRENGKVKHRTLRYLGKYRTVKAADAAIRKKAKAEALQAIDVKVSQVEVIAPRIEPAVLSIEEKLPQIKVKAPPVQKKPPEIKAKVSPVKLSLAESKIEKSELEAELIRLMKTDAINTSRALNYDRQGKWEQEINEDDLRKAEYILNILWEFKKLR